jgi:hypothetical protein
MTRKCPSGDRGGGERRELAERERSLLTINKPE